ncbi:MAG: nucleoid-associated protein [Clostridia bacterium]|nr:nucleoid-associated protein [Clostridia bacterium]
MDYEISIIKAVLHILDNNITVPVLSETELEIESEISELFEKYIAKVLEDNNLKNASFTGDSNRVRYLCSVLNASSENFLDTSHEIAAMLFDIMVKHVDISPADLICCLFSLNHEMHFGIFKLNYKTGFTHFVQHTDEGNSNTIIRHRTLLPSEGQKVDECALINLENFTLKVLEKQYEIDGEKEFYLSKMFLSCSTDLSNNAKLKILDRVTQKINEKYFDEGFDKVAAIKKVVTESLEEASAIKVDNLVERVFENNLDIQKEYIEEVQKAGLMEEAISIPETLAVKRFGTHKIKTDIGVEISFPSSLYDDKDKIEFVNNPDGTISIIIKNVGKITNK